MELIAFHRPTLLSMFKPGEVKLKPVPCREPVRVEESTSHSDLDTSIKSSGRRGPRETKKKFKAAGKSIKDIISSFQNKANEVSLIYISVTN